MTRKVQSQEVLLKGAALVERLAELGLGTWTPDAVRRWIDEPVPCPIAQPGRNGQAHHYRLSDVIVWLRQRDERNTEPDQDGAEPPVMVNGHPVFSDPRHAKAYHEARLAQLKADELERKLVPADELERTLIGLTSMLNAALDQLGYRIGTALQLDAENRALVLEVINGVRNRLADGKINADEPAKVNDDRLAA